MAEKQPEQKSLLEEIGTLALWLSLPDLTVSGLIVWLVGLARPNPISDLQTIWSVFLATFPLTIALAFIVFLHKEGDLNLISGSLTLVIAAFIGDLLHIGSQFSAAMPTGSLTGSSFLVAFAAGLLGVYLTSYGPLLFLKSCLLGYVLGQKLS